MEDNRHYNKHLMLYLCVGACGALILGGWIISVRASFDEMRNDAAGDQQSAVDDVMTNFDGIIKDGEDFLKSIDKIQADEKNAQLEAQLEALKKQTDEMNKKLEQLPVQPAPDAIPVDPAKPETADDSGSVL
jgi:peptidoglycan hydrolase CwlO-like protein